MAGTSMFLSPLKWRMQLIFLLVLALVASKPHSAPSEAAAAADEALPRFAVTPVDKAATGAGANATDHVFLELVRFKKAR